MECPRCRSHSVYRSKRGNAALPFFARWFLVALRCHNCGRELMRFAPLCSVESRPSNREPEGDSVADGIERVQLPRLRAER